MKLLPVLFGILLPALGSAATVDPQLGFDGLGSAKIGLSFEDVRHLWPDEIQPLDDGLKASAHCYHVRFYLLNGVVTGLSAGNADAVALDEGCN
jgi:hypothetical protein